MAAAVLPEDVLVAAPYRKAVKQLRTVWQILTQFASFLTRQVSDGLHFADCCSLSCARATGGAIVTVQEEAEITCNHFKAVAAQSSLAQAASLGLPAQLAAFQAQMTGQQAQLAEQLAALQLQVNAIQAVQEQHHRNSLLRLANSHALAGDIALQVTNKEKAGGLQPLGTQPAVQPHGAYPATVSELRALTHAQLDMLGEFYNEHFGIGLAAAQPGQATTPILQRRRMFALFVGSPQP